MVKIRLEDIEGVQRELAEIVGIDNYVALCKHFGGDNIYIQKYTELIKIERNAEIRKKYNGYNSNWLAKEYNLSERYVRFICSGGQLDGQMSLFDKEQF